MGNMRLVLDASTLLAATRGLPDAHALLRAVREQRHEACASLPLLLQWESALLAGPDSGADARRAFARALAALCQPAWLCPLWRPQCRDPVDDLLLATAHAARATHIVLARPAPRLAARAPTLGIALVTPTQALQLSSPT